MKILLKVVLMPLVLFLSLVMHLFQFVMSSLIITGIFYLVSGLFFIGSFVVGSEIINAWRTGSSLGPWIFVFIMSMTIAYITNPYYGIHRFISFLEDRVTDLRELIQDL